MAQPPHIQQSADLSRTTSGNQITHNHNNGLVYVSIVALVALVVITALIFGGQFRGQAQGGPAPAVAVEAAGQ